MRRAKLTQKLCFAGAVSSFIASGLITTSSASESYEDWRIRTGLTSVALFYTEQGLEKTCHGFWARDYVETDPNSVCFRATTDSGVVAAGSENLASVTPPEPEAVAVEDPKPTPPNVEVIETEPEPKPKPKPEPKTKVGPSLLTVWTVQLGDHLWGISSHPKVYNDPHRWPLLYKTNRHQLKDADLLQPGQVLDIDRDHSASEIQRAIQHAKTRGPWVLGIVELSDIEYLSRERSYQ